MVSPSVRRRRVLMALAAMALVAPAPVLAADKEKAEKDTDPFVELPTLTASVIQPNGRRGVLTVQAGLYLAAPAQKAKAVLAMPLLLNAYVPALQAWAYGMIPGSTPKVDLLASSLQRATDGVLGPGARLLLGGVMVN